MTDKDPIEPNDGDDQVRPDAEAGASEAPASGAPAGSDGSEGSEQDELTVDEILDAEQTDEAAEQEKSDYETQLLHDLKRIQAEYANYRRRTEEQRHVEIARAKGEVAKRMLAVLDDLDRAAKAGDLEEGSPFALVAEKMRGVANDTGLVAYGEAGEAFDPQQHEAVFQAPTPGTEQPTILEVIEVGYRLGDVELRPAKVVVAVPAE